MAVTGWLVDKSALVRLGDSLDAASRAQRIERGLVRITTVTPRGRLLGPQCARCSLDVHVTTVSAMPVEHHTPATEHRALEVQRLLAGQGQHRAPSITDLVLEAAAELAGLTALHLDEDFDLIAGVTGEPVQRLRDRADR